MISKNVVEKLDSNMLITLHDGPKKSILPTKTFCVGHSLGAHVCGFMGRESDVQLDKIIGMDPAGPIFEKNFEFDRLNSGSAKMVEAIHTNTG